MGVLPLHETFAGSGRCERRQLDKLRRDSHFSSVVGGGPSSHAFLARAAVGGRLGGETFLERIIVDPQHIGGPRKSMPASRHRCRLPQRIGNVRVGLTLSRHPSNRRRSLSSPAGSSFALPAFIGDPPRCRVTTANHTRCPQTIHTRLPEGHEERVKRLGFEQAMEAFAYTWFNRLVAIRFMELHGYLEHGYRVLSHPDGKLTPRYWSTLNISTFLVWINRRSST